MNTLILILLFIQQAENEELTGLSWGAGFIFWGGLIAIVLFSILYLIKKRRS